MESFSYIAKAPKGVITSKFGNRFHPVSKKWKKHSGLDIAHKTGTEVLAMADGVVIDSKMANNNCGGTIEIDHGDINGKKIKTRFCHCSKLEKDVGDQVKKGEVIAKSGGGPTDEGRGTSTGAHIHFEVYENGTPVDPTPYYNGTITYKKPETNNQDQSEDLPTPDDDSEEISPELSKALKTLTPGSKGLDLFGGKLDPLVKGFEKAFGQFGMNSIVKEDVDRIKNLMNL